MIELPGGGAPGVYDLYIAGRASAVLAVAVRLDLFSLLDRAPATAEQVASALDLSERGARALLHALRALGLLEIEGDVHRLTDGARTLLPSAHGSLAGLIDMDFDHFPTPGSLLEAMRSGAPTVYSERDVWDAHVQDPVAAAKFTAAMHAISEAPAAALAAAWSWGDGRLLDVGGGSGAFPIAILKARPAMTAELLDLEPVCVEADRRFAAAGLADRAVARAGDLFDPARPYPEADVVLFSQILHDWPPDACLNLLQRAADALPAGGTVLIHEKLVADAAPVANVLVDLDMLFWTEGRQYSAGELRAMLGQAGFVDVRVERTTGYWSVVSATLGPR